PSGAAARSTCTGSSNSRRRRTRNARSVLLPAPRGSEWWTFGGITSARIRRRNTIPHSTSRSLEGHALLALVGPGPTVVRLGRGRVERQEDNLGEPLADRELQDVGRRVERAEREGAGETRGEHSEGCNDPSSRPRGPARYLTREV